MAIYEGAGIHGTEEVESLGSAASHGCVRMAIADVEQLYEQVEVGTPIFIG
jgi:lipoprotein-anchoring transpeptidase ErfK/SrfK